MSLFYSVSIYVYASLIRIASLFNGQAHRFIQGRKGQFRNMEKSIGNHDELVWFHCASLGEFEQGRPLIEDFRTTFPGYKILLTFFSPSGFELQKDYPLADYIFYLPLDKPANVRRFLKIFHPKLVVFIKYEFWFNYLDALYRNKIPFFLVSAIFRKNQHFFQFYGSWFRKQLLKVSWFFVQNKTSASLLNSVKINHFEISGDTRFDRVMKIRQTASKLPFIETFKNGNKLLIAGSTWPADEEILKDYLDQTHNQLKLIIAPHKTDETHIRSLLQQFKTFKPVLYSQASNADLVNNRLLIIDRIGLLSAMYQYADLAYVGGGFGVGIHNLLEAAVYGIPVIFGPNYARFQEAHDLIEAGGGFSIDNQDALQRICEKLLSTADYYHEAAKASENYVKEHAGATDRVMSKIKEYLLTESETAVNKPTNFV